MGKHEGKKDERTEAEERADILRQLPTFQTNTPYDKYTEKPAPVSPKKP